MIAVLLFLLDTSFLRTLEQPHATLKNSSVVNIHVFTSLYCCVAVNRPLKFTVNILTDSIFIKYLFKFLKSKCNTPCKLVFRSHQLQSKWPHLKTLSHYHDPSIVECLRVM